MPALRRTSWYVFCVAPNSEQDTCKALGRHAIEALSPRTRTFERISRRRMVEHDAVLFPGYVFACVFGPLWPRLQRVRTIRPQPLAMDGEPYRLTEADVALVRELQEHPLADPRAPVAPRKYMTGEMVRILQGPFASFSATVDADRGRKVHVSAQIFGRPTPVTLQREWLEAA